MLTLFRLAVVAIVLVAASLIVGWNYRTTRFASGLRIVEENGGSFTHRSDWQAHATDIRIGRQTDLDDLSMILSLLMAGQVDKIDFSDVEITKSDIRSLPNWENNSIETVEWPVETDNNAG
ncbi:MAG: hypothetical protein Aurels2KO_32570 [Aureliella sp.]